MASPIQIVRPSTGNPLQVGNLCAKKCEKLRHVVYLNEFQQTTALFVRIVEGVSSKVCFATKSHLSRSFVWYNQSPSNFGPRKKTRKIRRICIDVVYFHEFKRKRRRHRYLN